FQPRPRPRMPPLWSITRVAIWPRCLPAPPSGSVPPVPWPWHLLLLPPLLLLTPLFLLTPLLLLTPLFLLTPLLLLTPLARRAFRPPQLSTRGRRRAPLAQNRCVARGAARERT